LRLTQICNHPSHWLNDNVWAEEDSGQMGAPAADRRGGAAGRRDARPHQFREMTAPLETFLSGIFNRPGLVLHGSIAREESQGRSSRPFPGRPRARRSSFCLAPLRPGAPS